VKYSNGASIIQAQLLVGRAIEDILEHLVNRADAALETSCNQPVLPHVTTALNATEKNIDEQLWDLDIAISTVPNSLCRTVF
jgi:hypothetical protein